MVSACFLMKKEESKGFMKKSTSVREQGCEWVIDDLETKYLGENMKKSVNDKYFRMLLQGMSEEDAIAYTKAKLTLIREYHR